MINITLSLITKYGITFDNNRRILVDGANPSFVRSLKYQLGDNAGNRILQKSYHDIYNLDFLIRNMFVIPVHFAKEHRLMLAHAKAKY
jgi:hypothetical protein